MNTTEYTTPLADTEQHLSDDLTELAYAIAHKARGLPLPSHNAVEPHSPQSTERHDAMSTPGETEQRPSGTELPAFLMALAVDDAPRCFAIAYDYSDPDDSDSDDGGIVAYGMAFHDRTETVSIAGDYRVRTTKPEHACRHFTEDGATMHVIWLPASAMAT
ncbi:hypothetical protein ACQPZF_10720 [Actinosynnema sp. CS-041913]|uniref:hypothetical protein n=1 Tax=Actinosynnema sp. CS-041913 TaxID=3239917 RepID=UPI003D8E075E